MVVQYMILDARAEAIRHSEAEKCAAKMPERATPAWDLARVKLEAYFDRNLNQISAIFWLCALVMLAGFGILIYGVNRAFMNPTQITPALLAGFAGVMTEFIAATFLFIYRSTVQQAATFAQTLERMNTVGMAIQILDSLPDEATEADMKMRAKAAIAELLIRNAQEVPPSSLNLNEEPSVS